MQMRRTLASQRQMDTGAGTNRKEDKFDLIKVLLVRREKNCPIKELKK